MYKLKPHAFTSDQGSNYVMAIDSLRVPRLICVAHNLNLVVTDLFNEHKGRENEEQLKSFKLLIDKLRSIAKWPTLSATRTAALFNAQKV